VAAPVRLPAYGPAAGHSSGARPCFESAAGHACLSHGAARAPAGKHHAQAVQRGGGPQGPSFVAKFLV